MRILVLLYVYLLVLHSEGSVSVPAPVNTKVLSNNFIHILQWSPGNGTQPGTVYTVKVGNNQVPNINGTSVDISEYTSDQYRTYVIRLWASFANSSSSKVKIHFTPYTSTIIGPPRLSLIGCGDCLNISIDLPNRQNSSESFYNAISFDILWRKVSDEKDGCHNPFTNFQSKKSVSYSDVLPNLEPGERYCLQAQPKVISISESNLLSSCSCEFTSRIEPRGVAFLAGWVLSSVLVGLCFLIFVFLFVYTGLLYKPRLPKALIVLVPGSVLSPEEACISVAEIEDGIQIHKPEDHQEKKKQKNNNDDDEEEEEDEETHSGYMNRAGPSESESSGSVRSASDGEAAENPRGCGFEDALTHATDALLLSQVQYDGVKGYSLGVSLDTVKKTLNPPRAKGGKRLAGEMKEGDEEEDCGNVNLWSVVLRSMQPEDEEANEPSDAKEPLLPSLLKELGKDSLTAAKPQAGSSLALLSHTQTEAQSSQKEEKDVSDAGVCDYTRTGYMASHTGTIDTESSSSEDEEEDCTSGYMIR